MMRNGKKASGAAQGDRATSFWSGLARQNVPAAVLAGGLLCVGLAGCSAVGRDDTYPNLATVPERPVIDSPAARQELTRGLVGDRANAHYTEQAVERDGHPTPLLLAGAAGQGGPTSVAAVAATLPPAQALPVKPPVAGQEVPAPPPSASTTLAAPAPGQPPAPASAPVPVQAQAAPPVKIPDEALPKPVPFPDVVPLVVPSVRGGKKANDASTTRDASAYDASAHDVLANDVPAQDLDVMTESYRRHLSETLDLPPAPTAVPRPAVTAAQAALKLPSARIAFHWEGGRTAESTILSLVHVTELDRVAQLYRMQHKGAVVRLVSHASGTSLAVDPVTALVNDLDNAQKQADLVARELVHQGIPAKVLSIRTEAGGTGTEVGVFLGY